MANDPGQIPMEDPLAYFITWTTYGSWLPTRLVDKPGQFRVPDAQLKQAAQ